MKKLLVFFLPVFILCSCQSSNENSTVTKILEYQPVKITGEIENPVDEEVSLKGEGVDTTAKVTDGKFVLDFQLNQPTKLTFKHGKERSELYLEPGDDVSMTLNPEQFDETLRLAGEGSEESNYLLEKYIMNEKHSSAMKENFSLPINEFTAKMDEIKKENQDFLKTYSKTNNNMNADFIKSASSNIVYDWASSKINYPSYYKYFTKDENLDLGDNYFSFMDKIDMNDEAAYNNDPTYKRMISSYLSTMGEDAGDGIENLGAMFNIADQKINNKTIKSGILFNALNGFLRNNDATGAEKYVTQFNNMATDEDMKKKLADTYEVAKKLLKGNPAPTFNYTNTAGESVALESLKGKNVYIDVWATWCGPCMREIPSLKELEKQYHGSDDIVFMSVSIDKMKDKEKWVNMIDDKELTGVQLMADKDWKSSICADYSINGIPRFILIDKEGNIMDKNAPRPSSPEIKTILADIAKPGMTSMN